MNLKLSGNGSDLRSWILIALCAILSLVLLSKHGEKLIIYVYNNNPRYRRNKGMFNEKKLSRVIGVAMALVAVILLVLTIWGSVIPDSFMGIFPFLTIAVLFGAILVAYTTCRK